MDCSAYLLEALRLPCDLLSIESIGNGIRQAVKACISFCGEHLPVLPLRVQKEESQDEYAADLPPIIMSEDELAKIDELNDRTVKDEARDTIQVRVSECTRSYVFMSVQGVAKEIVPALHRIICEFSLDPGRTPSPAQSAWLTTCLEAMCAVVKYQSQVCSHHVSVDITIDD